MVLAEFLNTNLLEPLKQRLRDEGYAEGFAQGYAEGVAQCHAEGFAQGYAEGVAQGRAEAIAVARSRLLENGINPDVLFPADAPEVASEQQDDASRS